MLKHIVLMDATDDAALDQIVAAMDILAALPGQIPGVLDFNHGPNLDFEGKSDRYAYGFVLSFADKAANDAYVVHPDHQRAGAILVASCKGGADGIFVADLEV
jgi:hypothetical protein